VDFPIGRVGNGLEQQNLVAAHFGNLFCFSSKFLFSMFDRKAAKFGGGKFLDFVF